MSSALESAACLDVLVAKNHFKVEEVEDGKKQLLSIVSMLMGLIATFSDRVREEGVEYEGTSEEIGSSSKITSKSTSTI
jgi:hypothetical protein